MIAGISKEQWTTPKSFIKNVYVKVKIIQIMAVVVNEALMAEITEIEVGKIAFID